jgi:pimeloyl-ACP methyl ester carboxylesterase
MVRYGGEGKPLVLLHNTYLGSEAFLRHDFLQRLADKYAVFAPDAIGQGDSDLPDHALSVEEHAENLGDIIDALGVGKVNIFASHTGASVAMHLAATQPDKIDKLIFAGLPMWRARGREKLSQMDRFKAWDYSEDGSHLSTLWEERLGITKGLNAEQMHNQFLAFLRPGPRVHEPLHALFNYEPREKLPDVKVPVLAVAAEGDQFLEAMPEITEAIPSSKTAVLPRGTLLHALDPDAAYKAITEFIG